MVNLDEGAVLGRLAVLGGYAGAAAKRIPRQEMKGTSKNPDLRASAARIACLPHFILYGRFMNRPYCVA